MKQLLAIHSFFSARPRTPSIDAEPSLANRDPYEPSRLYFARGGARGKLIWSIRTPLYKWTFPRNLNEIH